MRSILVVPLAVIAVLGWLLYSQITAMNTTLREQQKQIHALEEKLSTKAMTTDLLDFQERCATQAQRAFQSEGYKVGGTSKVTDFENHYNPELRKCFLVINYTDFTSPNGPTVTKLLADAYERKIYGEYTWIGQKNKSAWEVAPMECHVTNPSGEKKFCKSEDEFNALVAIYMK